MVAVAADGPSTRQAHPRLLRVQSRCLFLLMESVKTCKTLATTTEDESVLTAVNDPFIILQPRHTCIFRTMELY